MADFCSICNEIMFGDKVAPDYDLTTILSDLQPGQVYHLLCEGCGMISYGKDYQGQPIVLFVKDGKPEPDFVPFSKELIIEKFNEAVNE
jgi:hypothetical protein